MRTSQFSASYPCCVVVMVLLLVPAPALASGPAVRIEGLAGASGRTIEGDLVPFGTGPYILDLVIGDISITPNMIPGVGDSYAGGVASFSIDIPFVGLTLGGVTANNFLDGAHINGDADTFQFFIGDCATVNCSIPIGAIGNTEALGFEGLFGAVDYPNGTIPPTNTLAELLAALAGAPPPLPGQSFIDLTYVPALLLPPLVAVDAEPQPDIRFFFLQGGISQVTIVPLPASVLLLAPALLLLGAAAKRRVFPS